MRQLNPAELFYLQANASKDVNELANALMTTEDHVRLLLTKITVCPDATKRKRGRPKKVTVAAPAVVEAVKPPSLALENMARIKDRGAIAMTKEASEVGDELQKAAAAKLPDGVFKFNG